MRYLAPTFMRVDSVVTVMLLSLVEVASARFRARRVMNLDGTSVAFVSVCLLTLSCLHPLCCFVLFFFCQCDILATASFGNAARLLSELFGSELRITLETSD